MSTSRHFEHPQFCHSLQHCPSCREGGHFRYDFYQGHNQRAASRPPESYLRPGSIWQRRYSRPPSVPSSSSDDRPPSNPFPRPRSTTRSRAFSGSGSAPAYEPRTHRPPYTTQSTESTTSLQLLPTSRRLLALLRDERRRTVRCGYRECPNYRWWSRQWRRLLVGARDEVCFYCRQEMARERELRMQARLEADMIARTNPYGWSSQDVLPLQYRRPRF